VSMQYRAIVFAAAILALGSSGFPAPAKAAEQDCVRPNLRADEIDDCKHVVKSGRVSAADYYGCWGVGLNYASPADRKARIPLCTRMIEAGGLSKDKLATAYHMRAMQTDDDNADAAIADFTRSIDLVPTVGSYSNRAKRYHKQERFDAAIDDLTAALDLNRSLKYPASSPQYLYEARARAYLGKRDYGRAIPDLDEAVKHQSIWYYFRLRGAVHVLAQNYGLAVSDFSRSIELLASEAKPFAPILLDRARAYRSLGDRARAAADFEQVIADGKIAPVVKEAAAKELAELMQGQTAVVVPPQPATQITAAVPAAGVARPERGETRVALVVANGAYRTVSALSNPSRDGARVASALRATGFETILIENDVTREALVKVLRSFEDAAAHADWAVVYYAGHGIEVAGVNYLVPVDARLRTDRDIQDEAVSLERVLASVERARKLRLVILDACRDNPFAARMKTAGATRSIGRGLSRIEPEGGSLVAYAAKHGFVAFDGDGESSPFVDSLVKHIQTPNLEINKLFRLVRDDVLKATDRKQEPFVYGSLPGEDFYFVER
jgi:tetratricopeptide (TPR) repeat protein